MAMDFIASRATLFGQESRPVSRASSTTTEFTSRPLLREIDYIRSLISHATITSKPAEYSITAQVFRRAPQNVTQAQILQELDALRRRVKYETRRPVLEPADPETDTDDDFHDAIDYDDEYESMRKANEQKEQMIENAEARVDKLADENEQIQSSVEALREDLKVANALVEKLKARQATQDTLIAEMRSIQQGSVQDPISLTGKAKAERSLPDQDGAIREDDEAAQDLRRQVDTLRSKLDESLARADRTTGEHEKDMRTQAEAHSTDIAALQSQHETSLSNKIAEYDNLLASRAGLYEEEMARMKQEYETASQAQAKQVSAAQEEALRLHTEKHDAAVADLKRQHEIAIHTRALEMENVKQQALLQAEEASLRRNEQEQAELVKIWSARVAIEAAQHKADKDAHVEQITEEHGAAARELDEQARARLTALQLAHQEEIVAMKQQQALMITKSEQRIQQALDNADASNCLQKVEHSRNLAELQRLHADEQESMLGTHRVELDSLKAAHLRSIHESSQAHGRAIVEMATKHQDELQGLKDQLDLALRTKERQDKDCSEYKEQLAQLGTQLEQCATSTEQLGLLEDRLRQQHAKQVEQLEAQTPREHQSTLKEAIEAATQKTFDSDAMAIRSMHKLLLQAQKDLRTSHEAELGSLRSDQSKEMAVLREELEISRRDYDALRALHASEVARLFAEREAATPRNGHKLLDRVLGKVDAQSATSEEVAEEDDARDTPRAHSLVLPSAEPGQLITVQETKEEAVDGSAVSVPPNCEGPLGSQAVPISSPRPAAPSAELEAVEEAPDDANGVSTGQKIAELEAQVLELQNQLAAQSSSRPRSDSYKSSGMQTAPRIEVIGSPKRSHKRNSSFPLSPSRYSFGPEIAKQLRWSDERPSTPTSPRPITPMSPKRWSMQDYVEGESPSVATASEAILSQKFQEHLNDLQQARDKLARQYQDRFDKLLAERKRQEKQITLEQADEFVRERELLATRYLLQERESLQNGSEEQLVRQYHQRLVKKKSQIRLQHAQDFHDLTQDYDRRLQELMAQQGDMEGLFSSTGLDQLSPVEPLKSPSLRSSSSIPRLIRKPSSQFEQTDEPADAQHRLRRQSGSPNIKQRTLSSSSSQKSKRHSSGMIYDKSRLGRT